VIYPSFRASTLQRPDGTLVISNTPSTFVEFMSERSKPGETSDAGSVERPPEDWTGLSDTVAPGIGSPVATSTMRPVTIPVAAGGAD
jgi:hypothetical protein